MEEMLKEMIKWQDKVTNGEIKDYVKKLLLKGEKTVFFLGKKWSWEELKQFFSELDLKGDE